MVELLFGEVIAGVLLIKAWLERIDKWPANIFIVDLNIVAITSYVTY